MTTIIDNTTKTNVRLWDIKPGECFKIIDGRFNTNDALMKTDSDDGNAIFLDGGELIHLPTDAECVVVNTKITLEN